MIICWYCHNKQYSKQPCPNHDKKLWVTCCMSRRMGELCECEEEEK